MVADLFLFIARICFCNLGIEEGHCQIVEVALLFSSLQSLALPLINGARSGP